MQVRIVRVDGSLYLGNDGEAAGFHPGTAVQIVRLSTGNLLLTLADDQPDVLDWSPVLAVHGRRALPRKAIDNGHPSE